MTTSYVWCDAGICQARNAGNAVTRAYYGEGEVVPGAPAQLYYYGADQIGSVRRVFASSGGAPAYAYDPYGSALQGTAPLTDFGYAGMFWHADSGLYLTQYRAYDPAVGRWLSRDPIGEGSDPAANLYLYVQDNPVNLVDPSGLQIPSEPPPGIPGGPWVPAGTGQKPGTFYGPKQQSGPKTICRWVPSQGQGGPPGSQGYWKVQTGGSGQWNRYSQNGIPITEQQAHPNPPPANPLAAIVRFGTPLGAFLGVMFYSSPAY